MIGVERISRLLRVLAASDAVVPAEARLSAILIAPSDAGKSQLLLSHLPHGARVLDDFTTASLYHLFEERKGNVAPSWVVVPDLNALIAHKPSVANLTFANLLSLLGEGTTEILGPDGSKVSVSDDGKPRKLGILTGITPDMMHGRRMKWRATGFLRRMIPIYYTYGTETQKTIQAHIRNGSKASTIGYERHEMSRVPKPRAVSINASEALEIEKLSEDVIRYQLRWGSEARSVKAFDLPFSVHKSFRRFAQSHARLNGRLTVKAKDLEALQDFARFVRYDQPEIL
jgi:hypothetical protein